jgi:hypothetical protein
METQASEPLASILPSQLTRIAAYSDPESESLRGDLWRKLVHPTFTTRFTTREGPSNPGGNRFF